MPADENIPRVVAPFELHDAVKATLPDVNQDVALLHLTLLHLGRIVESSIQSVIAPEGLEISEHSVLTALVFAGPPYTMSPTQLSNVILQTTSGMSKTLRRIERLGLIERVDDPNDGRSRLVVLTDKGREMSERPLRQLVDPVERAAARHGSRGAEQRRERRVVTRRPHGSTLRELVR